MGDDSPSGGVVEMFATSWASVCGDSFTDLDALSVCYQLGYTSVADYDRYGMASMCAANLTRCSACMSLQKCTVGSKKASPYRNRNMIVMRFSFVRNT